MVCVISEKDFRENQHIDSVKYYKKINWLVQKFGLVEKTGITNFCFCFHFGDRKYFLSNLPDWAIEYHKMGGLRCDEVFDLVNMKGRDHFFPRTSDYDDLQVMLVKKEEKKYGYYDTYSLIRRCIDCTFIFLSLHNQPLEDRINCYKRTREIFEEFSIFFIESMKEEIFLKNVEAVNFKIFNDSVFLRKVIKKDFPFIDEKLTKKELQCITLLKKNYSIKLVSRNLCLTEKTVRKYLENIKSKMSIGTTSELINVAFMIDI